MKYFKLYVLLLAGVFLTGCFGKASLPMEYTDDASYKNQLVKYMPADYGDISLGFLAEDLCVVPLDYQNTKNRIFSTACLARLCRNNDYKSSVTA